MQSVAKQVPVKTTTAKVMTTTTTATAMAAPAVTSGLFDRTRLVNYFDIIFKNSNALVSLRDIHGFLRRVGVRQEEFSASWKVIQTRDLIFRIRLNTREAVESFLDKNGNINEMVIGDARHEIYIADTSARTTFVQLGDVPIEITEENVKAHLEKYGKVKSVRRTETKGDIYLGGLTDRMIVIMDIQLGIPPKLIIDGFCILANYPGQPKTCWFCQESGHTKVECGRFKSWIEEKERANRERVERRSRDPLNPWSNKETNSTAKEGSVEKRLEVSEVNEERETEDQNDTEATPAESTPLSKEGERDSPAVTVSEVLRESEGSQMSNLDVFELTASQGSQPAEIEAGQTFFLSQPARQEGLPQRPLWSEIPVEDVEEGVANVSLKRDGTETNLNSAHKRVATGSDKPEAIPVSFPQASPLTHVTRQRIAHNMAKAQRK